MSLELPAVEPLTVGHAAGAALFALAMGVMVWPMVRRIVQAHRQRALELRVAAGSEDRK